MTAAARQTGGHMKPDAGGTIRAGMEGPGKLYLEVQPAPGPEGLGRPTVALDLDPEEAHLLGRWLIRMARDARRG